MTKRKPIKTDLQCQHASTSKAQEDVPVHGSPGLALRLSDVGRKVWTLRYRRQADGKLRRLTLGQYPDLSLADAKERARLARNDVSTGADPAGAKQERRSADTVAGLAEQWLAAKERQGRRASYVKNNRWRIARIPETLAEMKAMDVKRVHLTSALDEVAKRGEAETNATQRLLSSIFRWAVSEGLIDTAPTIGLKFRFDDKPRTRFFTADETRAFWRGLGTITGADPASIVAIRLCLLTGQRPSEIVSLRRADLVLDGLQPQITIRAEHAKNAIEHVVPIGKRSITLLREVLSIAEVAEAARSKRMGEPIAHSQWLFPSPKDHRKPIEAHALTRIIDRARDKKTGLLFGINDAQLYDCKKTVATTLGDLGFADEQVSRLLNHISVAKGTVTGRHYNHSTHLAEKRRMVEAWTRHLEALIDPANAEHAPSGADTVVALRS